jgi:hypothetical protein
MFKKKPTEITGCTISKTGDCAHCPHYVAFNETNTQTNEVRTAHTCRIDLLLQNSFVLVQRTTGAQAAAETLRDNVAQGNQFTGRLLDKIFQFKLTGGQP